VKKFLDRKPLPFPTLLDSMSDPPGSIAETMGISFTPKLIFVGSGGMVEKVMVGSFTGEEMTTSLRELVEEIEGLTVNPESVGCLDGSESYR
jgi:hypothetical protein